MDKAEKICIDCGLIFIKYGKNLRCVDCHYEYQKNPLPANRYYHIKVRAIQKGLDFTISRFHLDLLLKSPCYYCGFFDERIKNRTVDRKDNLEGYTDENTVAACRNCNTIKRDRTLEEFGLYLESKIV